MLRHATHVLSCVALIAGLSASPATAATITLAANSSESFDIQWSHLVGSTELSALGHFTLVVTDTYVDFLITLTNNTALHNERVHSIGFNTDPNASSLTNQLAGTYFQSFALNRNFPSYQRVDICAWTTQNCAGGAQPNNLPGLGTSDTFSFRLAGDFSGGITVEQFSIQFMGDLGSFQFEGDSPPVSVPEPATALLMAIGVVALALPKHRR